MNQLGIRSETSWKRDLIKVWFMEKNSLHQNKIL